MRPFATRGNAAKEAAFSRLLDTSARFRQLEARFSVIWAGALLANCAARVTVAVILPVNTVVWLSTVGFCRPGSKGALAVGAEARTVRDKDLWF